MALLVCRANALVEAQVSVLGKGCALLSPAGAAVPLSSSDPPFGSYANPELWILGPRDLKVIRGSKIMSSCKAQS